MALAKTSLSLPPMPSGVKEKFDVYPKDVRKRMLELRSLVFDCQSEPHIDNIEETLKWGEPSYLSRHGSTFRMDWKSRAPEQIGLYFNCQSRLIETIQEVYGDLFVYDGNRAILLDANQPFPRAQVQHCMILTLSYHKRKHQPLLGL